MEFQQLVVHWGNQILDVQECRVLAKYGEHTKAKVKAIGREEEEKENTNIFMTRFENGCKYRNDKNYNEKQK